MAKTIEYPRKGLIKATREVVTVHGEKVVAGIKCYITTSAGSSDKYDYQRGAIVLLPSQEV